MKPLEGKIAIVTGASRQAGIGTAICFALANAGADIFFTHWIAFDKTEGNGLEKHWPEALRRKLEDFGVRAHHMKLNLSDFNSHTMLLNQVENKLGTPNILVNNATYEAPSSFRSLSNAILDSHYEVNNRGTMMLCTEFAKRFEEAYPKNKDGRIINLVSGGPDPNNLAYIATKGALIAVTEPLAVALAPIGITVNSIDPGPTDSGWMDEHVKEHLLRLFPSGRLGVPEDAAKAITFLASEESYWVTGQMIRSNGGFIGK
ncbi:SDR family oxidoreductase [Bacillus manliponensis]|uniref:SDR family oxidoreductase n=1 Tax=Bacillus manliponensis TaxID=574376 RepID=UPI0035161609